jgi:hypothetical protein
MTPHLRPEGAVVRSLLDELVHRYSPSVGEERIALVFEECLAQFSSARIRDFVPVLAQRCAKSKLEALKAVEGTPSAGGNGSGSLRDLEVQPQVPAEGAPARVD